MGRIAKLLTVALLIGGIVAGLTTADYYLRREPVGKAKRDLQWEGVQPNTPNALAAAATNKVTTLQNLRLVGVPLEAADLNGETPLMLAVRRESREAVDYLLSLKEMASTVNAESGRTGLTAMGHALSRRDYALAERLRELGGSVDVSLETGLPALVEAIAMDDGELLTYLLEKAGAGLEMKDEKGMTALAHALEMERGDLVTLLLDKGASLDGLRNAKGESLLGQAVETGNHDLAALLLGSEKNAAEIRNASGPEWLYDAVDAQAVAMVDLLLSHEADPNLVPKGEAIPPLMLAIRQNSLPLVRLLTRHGANVEGSAVAILGYESGDRELLIALLGGGADPDACFENGERLIERALRDRNAETFRILLAAGARVDDLLWPAMKVAKDESYLDALLEAGVSPEFSGPKGELPLSFALRKNRFELAKKLLKYGAGPNLQTPEGEPMLAAAIREGNEGVATLLMDNGASIAEDLMAEDGHTLLEWALANKMPEMVKRLVAKGADVSRAVQHPAGEAFREKFKSSTFRYYLEKDRGITPLMLAVAKQDLDSARVLLDAGAKTSDYTKRDSIWPINIAAWFSDVPMMQLLLGRNPDPKEQEREIIIDLGTQEATLYVKGEEQLSTRVSTGKKGYGTPSGTYVVTNKHRDWTSTLYDAKMPYFLRLSCSAFGLHQGYVPDYPASHGCIRVPAGTAKKLFEMAQLGDIVRIQ